MGVRKIKGFLRSVWGQRPKGVRSGFTPDPRGGEVAFVLTRGDFNSFQFVSDLPTHVVNITKFNYSVYHRDLLVNYNPFRISYSKKNEFILSKNKNKTTKNKTNYLSFLFCEKQTLDYIDL